jgi:hypothetical protein
VLLQHVKPTSCESEESLNADLQAHQPARFACANSRKHGELRASHGDVFMGGLRTISSVADGGLVDLSSKERFRAHVDDSQSLIVDDGKCTWEFDTEDLHGAWVSLLRGLVTRDRVEWSTGEGGNFVITLLSLLPNTRPVEIQRGAEPEIAVELAPWARRINSTSPAHEQLKLEWH